MSLVYLFPISTVAPQGDCTFVIEKVKKDVVDIVFSNLNRLNLYKKKLSDLKNKNKIR